jgi:hypothetical protein
MDAGDPAAEAFDALASNLAQQVAIHNAAIESTKKLAIIE